MGPLGSLSGASREPLRSPQEPVRSSARSLSGASQELLRSLSGASQERPRSFSGASAVAVTATAIVGPSVALIIGTRATTRCRAEGATESETVPGRLLQ